MNLRATALLLTLLTAPLLAQTAQANPPLNANFHGDWVGTLEYRDFQTNERTFLPTWLTLTPAADGTSIHVHYIYDDGPTKTVLEDATLVFTPSTSKASLTSDNDHTTEAFDVQGLSEFAKLGRGTLVLTGPGTENKKPVDVRLTLTLRRNLYTLRKETRLPGEDYKFRDAYTFTRALPPTPK